METLDPLQLNRPPLLVDLIIERLQDSIINGTLLPLTRLAEEKLARELDTSRTPLREALIKLELLGFVRRRKSGGWAVPTLDVDKILERYEERIMLEVYAVLRSTPETRARFGGQVDPLLPRMLAAMERRDVDAYREADVAFHSLFPALGLNAHLRGRYEDTVKHIRWIRRVAINEFIDLAASYQDHLRIVETLRANDVQGAMKELNTHLERMIAHVRENLQRQQNRGAAAPG